MGKRRLGFWGAGMGLLTVLVSALAEAAEADKSKTDLMLPVAAATEAGEGETDYFAVFFSGRKAGHAVHIREVREGKIRSTETAWLSIERGGVALNISVTETAIETMEGKPVGFECSQSLGAMTIQYHGTINEQGKLEVTTSAAGTTQQRVLDWPKEALMAEGWLQLAKNKGLKEGSSYSAVLFSPAAMSAFEVDTRIGARQTMDLLGRVVPLTEVTTVMKMPSGALTTTSYVDEQLKPQKMIMPLMDMSIELVACTKEFALSPNDLTDFLDRLLVSSPTPLKNVESLTSLSYHLKAKTDGPLSLPATDNQTVRPDGEGGLWVTVSPVEAPGGVTFPYKGGDPAALEALKATRFVQSDSKVIRELAQKAVGDTRDAGEAARRIEVFVHQHVRLKDLSVGYATAVEVAGSGQGDCSEHALLTAALCRAVGIPAQVVAGYLYCENFGGRQNIFGGHAWTQALIGDKWVGLDATRAPNGFSAGHITQAIGNGDPEGFFQLALKSSLFEIVEIQDAGEMQPTP